MTVGADNQGVLAFLRRSIDGTKQVLSRRQFDTDILRGITIVLANFRQLGFQRTRIEERVELQTLANLLAQRVATRLPLSLVAVKARQIIEHHLTLCLMTTRILVGLDFIQVAALLPPVPVEVFADVVERHLDGVGAHAEISIRQSLANGIDIVFELHAKALLNVLHHL